MRARLPGLWLALVLLAAFGHAVKAQQPPPPPTEDAALQEKIKSLIAQLGGQDMKGQVAGRNASRELARIGKAAVPALLEAAKDKNPNVRWWSLSSLASIGDPVAIDTFLTCMRDANTTVRCVAVYNSRRYLSDERVRSTLLAMAPQADPDTRKWLLRTFVETKLEAAIPVVKEGLKNPDAQARAEFLEALTKLDPAGSLDAVKNVLAADADERVRASAAVCLDNVVAPPPPRVYVLFLRACPFVFWFGELEPAPRNILALLIAALDDKSLKVQCAAVLRLYRLTGKNFLFSPKSSDAERLEAIRLWKDWWEKNKT